MMLTVAGRLRLAPCSKLWRSIVLAEGDLRLAHGGNQAVRGRRGLGDPASAGTRLLCSIIKVHLHTMRLGATSDVVHTVNGAGPFPSVRVLNSGGPPSAVYHVRRVPYYTAAAVAALQCCQVLPTCQGVGVD